MYLILYNPISRNGANTSVVEKLVKRMKKRHEEVRVKSLFEIDNAQAFISALDKNTKVIIVGGDGTLNTLANEIRDCKDLPEIYLYKAGTGNDFRRSIKKRGKVIRIDEYFKNLPQVNFNSQNLVFLNGVGLGFDAEVCYIVEEAKSKKTKLNFFTSVFKALKSYKRVDYTVEVDGVKHTYKNVWMATIMNSKYFGGGMKIAPKAKREDEYLYVIIIHNISKFKLTLLFPIIYLGWHGIIRGVKIIRGKQVKVKSESPLYLQLDGEVYNNILELEVNR